MADVFISYSKAHAQLTRDLARDIEAKGLTVWWDTEMVPGESFRQRIQQELKAARAVIVIWTPESIHSDYVLSEAERARLAGKLIQVRTDEVEPHDLPPPFDTSHVALIEDRNGIFGGLARFGLLPDFKPDPSIPLPVYKPSRSGRAQASTLWMLATAAVGVVALVVLWRGSGGTSLSGEAGAKDVAGKLIAGLSAGVPDSALFASEVRLGRRGLMSRAEAVAELRKSYLGYLKVACRSEGAPAIVGPGEKAEKGFRAKVAVVCDLTDKAGQTTTKRVPLEIETTPDAQGALVVSGLWQPEANVFWQPRERN